MTVADQIRKKLGTLPHKPGIYLMRDRFGTVIYVGKARDLRKRVSQYFQPSRRLGWDLKFKALIDAIQDFDFHVVRSEPEALLLEGKLIKEFHPRYNVSFRDDKRFLMLKVNLNDPIPRFTLTRLKQDDGARNFGPFPNSGALRSTLALVRRQYHLRGCRPLTPTERDYKHCLYGHLKYCTAPCIGNVAREEYLGQVTAACRFPGRPCAVADLFARGITLEEDPSTQSEAIAIYLKVVDMDPNTPPRTSIWARFTTTGRNTRLPRGTIVRLSRSIRGMRLPISIWAIARLNGTRRGSDQHL